MYLRAIDHKLWIYFRILHRATSCSDDSEKHAKKICELSIDESIRLCRGL